MAAAGVVGGLLGSAISAGVSASESKKARKFQKRVLQNQIQWRVRDLKLAGINPILAAGSGLGGGGAPAPVQPSIPDFGSSAAAGARAGADVKRSKADVRQRQTQADANNAIVLNQKAQAAKANAGVDTERAQQLALQEAANYSANNARVAEANADLLRSNLPQARAIADMWDDPSMKRVMQFKHLMSGTPLVTRPPANQSRPAIPFERLPRGARRGARPKLNPIPRRKR
ncbi:DNA pilot protein [Microviridae sp.]|nr:DNA pilot protein [Microviridae sp.]